MSTFTFIRGSKWCREWPGLQQMVNILQSIWNAMG